MSDPISLAAARVLARRAAALRGRASALITTVPDSTGQPVQIVAPEARVMLGTAEFFEICAADLRGGAA